MVWWVDKKLQNMHLKGLNLKQREAVTTTEGPLLIIAGAGAGKTKTIVHRILEIIAQGAQPEEILAVTFTNKAAREMRERIAKLLPSGSNLPLLTTFHSLGVTIMREHGQKPSDFFLDIARKNSALLNTFLSVIKMSLFR